MEEGAIVVESTDISSSPEKKKRKTDDGNSSPSRPSPLVILINMPTHGEEVRHHVDRWYTMKIPADTVDGYEGWICEVWRRKTLPWRSSTVALLGSDLYCLGGRTSRSGFPNAIPNVWKLNIRNATPTDDWISVQPMICPRAFPHALALGGKLYVLSGATFSRSGFPPTACGVEVYDPMTGSWEALPDPPCQIGYCTISAALENPNRILVTSNPKILPSKDSDDEDYEGPFYDYSSVNFLMYDVQNCSWKMLDPACRQIHPLCPWRNHGEAVAVGNCLYWVTTYVDLLAYDFQLDLWLIGDLRVLNVPFLEYDYEPRVPGLFHLENERFCLIQHRGPSRCFVHCVLFDVSPMLEEKKLRISYVSTIKYEVPYQSPVVHSFLMGK